MVAVEEGAVARGLLRGEEPEEGTRAGEPLEGGDDGDDEGEGREGLGSGGFRLVDYGEELQGRGKVTARKAPQRSRS